MGKAINRRELNQIIIELKASAKKHRHDNRPGRRRSGVRRYLTYVYRTYLDLRSRRIAKSAARRIIKMSKLKCRTNAHPIRVLIEASVGHEDNRAKSRWTQALRYAHGWKTKPERLKWFFRSNGGISGAAALVPERDGTSRLAQQITPMTAGLPGVIVNSP